MQAVPMAVIARQLGHSDTRMTERHYAHLAPNYVADTIRASFPRLTGVEAPTVVPIGRARMNYFMRAIGVGSPAAGGLVQWRDVIRAAMRAQSLNALGQAYLLLGKDAD
jgi:hypothetical protein